MEVTDGRDVKEGAEEAVGVIFTEVGDSMNAENMGYYLVESM